MFLRYFIKFLLVKLHNFQWFLVNCEKNLRNCASIVLFENIKNDKVDCCFCINVELSHDDRVSILNYKLKNITEITEKVKIDEQKMVKRGNFKPGCCDCNLF